MCMCDQRLYRSRSGAMRRMLIYGGWVIDGGQELETGHRTWWWTDCEGTAVDLVLPLVGECRRTAERVVTDPRVTQPTGGPALTRRTCVKLLDPSVQ